MNQNEREDMDQEYFGRYDYEREMFGAEADALDRMNIEESIYYATHCPATDQLVNVCGCRYCSLWRVVSVRKAILGHQATPMSCQIQRPPTVDDLPW